MEQSTPKKKISLLIFLTVTFFNEYNIYKFYLTENGEYLVLIFFITFFILSLLVYFNFIKKNEKLGNIFYIFIFVPIFTIFTFEIYRHYFLISQRESYYVSKNGKSMEIYVYGTASQKKIYKVLISGINKNFYDTTNLKESWIRDTIWIYYNSNGKQIEKRKSPKKLPKHIIYSGPIY